jgi:hypothetical protein
VSGFGRVGDQHVSGGLRCVVRSTMPKERLSTHGNAAHLAATSRPIDLSP